MDNPNNYTRLARGFLGMSSLWRGEDHLLYVRGKGYLIPVTEEYRRYRFADIQAISISKKSRVGRTILYLIGLLFFAGPLALVFGLMDRDDFGMGAAISISALALGALLFVSLLLRHLILGPTCVCDLQTSISRDRILPLNRYHAAREAVATLGDEIRAAQGDLAEGRSSDAGLDRLDISGRTQSGFSIPLPVFPTFIGMIVFGLGALATLHLESVVLTGIMLLVLLVVNFLITFSLIASIRKPTPESIRSILWIVLGLLFVFVGTATVYLLISAARNPVYTLNFSGPLEALTGVAAEGGVGFYGAFLLLSLGFFGAGIAGVMNTRMWRGRIEAATERERQPEIPESE